MMNKNLEDGEAIGSKWLSKAIETAQKKVEARNYDIRKQVVEYDNVMNDKRKVIYEQRGEIIDSETVDEVMTAMRAETVRSEEHTSELQSLMRSSYAILCWKKKNTTNKPNTQP